jgi:hypothetical protein
MEQDDILFEFKLGKEAYRFEAPSLEEAEKFRSIAMDFFRNTVGLDPSGEKLEGPVRVKLPEGFRIVHEPNA